MNQKPEIKTLSIDDMKAWGESVSPICEDIVILRNRNARGIEGQMFCLECFVIIFCTEGEARFVINSRDYTLTPDYCAILLPNTMAAYKGQDVPGGLRSIAFSVDYLRSTLGYKKETWDVAFHLYFNPVLRVTGDEPYKFYLYRELVLTLLNEKPHPYSREIIRYLCAAIFCEILSEVNRRIPQDDRPGSDRGHSAHIFRRFIELVATDDGTHRSIRYYADQLCYSPKHIFSVVKRYSGKAPMRLIKDHAIEQIKYQLANSDMSMKELADYFNFPNPSFFGKFVKGEIGMSPMQYRNSLKR